MKTRWVTVFKTCPEVLMTQEMIVFTNDLGNMKKSADSNNDDSIIEEPIYKSNDKYKCSCGASVLYRNKQRHEKTAKHMKNA